MKSKALIIFGLLILLTAGNVIGKTVSTFNSRNVTLAFFKITLEQARKIALKKVEGTIEDEYTFEDEDGKVTTYVFIITNKEEKTFEVQIDAENGDVLSSEELADEEDMEEEPPSI